MFDCLLLPPDAFFCFAAIVAHERAKLTALHAVFPSYRLMVCVVEWMQWNSALLLDLLQELDLVLSSLMSVYLFCLKLCCLVQMNRTNLNFDRFCFRNSQLLGLLDWDKTVNWMKLKLAANTFLL